MGYVEFILKNRSKAQTVTPSASNALFDLPGFKRREGIVADEKERARKEYNHCLDNLRSLNKKLKSTKGDNRKHLRAAISEVKEHMNGLLTIVGSYTSSEEVYGFKEGGHEF
jgi:hypothetical protein